MAATANYRRYKRGENPYYDERYNGYVTRSAILNRGLAERDFSKAFSLSTLAEINQELKFQKQLHTNADDGSINDQLNQVEAKINSHKSECELSGIPLSIKPVEQNLMNQKYDLEARLDAKQLEIDKLEKMRQDYLKLETKERNTKMLRHGPQGARYGEPLKEADYQTVGMVGNVNVIIEEGSPYRGMSVLDYMQKVVQPWITNKTKPLMYRKYSLRDVAREDLPKWPDGVVNHFQKPKEEKELKRTK